MTERDKRRVIHERLGGGIVITLYNCILSMTAAWSSSENTWRRKHPQNKWKFARWMHTVAAAVVRSVSLQGLWHWSNHRPVQLTRRTNNIMFPSKSVSAKHACPPGRPADGCQVWAGYFAQGACSAQGIRHRPLRTPQQQLLQQPLQILRQARTYNYRKSHRRKPLIRRR